MCNGTSEYTSTNNYDIGLVIFDSPLGELI